MNVLECSMQGWVVEWPGQNKSVVDCVINDRKGSRSLVLLSNWHAREWYGNDGLLFVPSPVTAEAEDLQTVNPLFNFYRIETDHDRFVFTNMRDRIDLNRGAVLASLERLEQVELAYDFRPLRAYLKKRPLDAPFKRMEENFNGLREIGGIVLKASDNTVADYLVIDENGQTHTMLSDHICEVYARQWMDVYQKHTITEFLTWLSGQNVHGQESWGTFKVAASEGVLEEVGKIVVAP